MCDGYLMAGYNLAKVGVRVRTHKRKRGFFVLKGQKIKQFLVKLFYSEAQSRVCKKGCDESPGHRTFHKLFKQQF